MVVHDSLGGGLSVGSAETMLVVLIGGYLTAGGANAINMWYDRDIDPMMRRTENRAIPMGRVSAESALFFGISIAPWELHGSISCPMRLLHSGRHSAFFSMS